MRRHTAQQVEPDPVHHLIESELKRDMVRQFLREGGWARRIEDKYAVGTPDCLFIGPHVAVFAEVKIMRDVRALPASVAQRVQIERINGAGNSHFRAVVIGYRDGKLGFGKPGTVWDERFSCPWPNKQLIECMTLAVLANFGAQDQ